MAKLSDTDAMKVLHVVGARPNFPKLAPVYDALADRGVEQVVVHTGQHFDREMSDEMLRDLGLGSPDINLGVGSGSHATQTAAVLQQIEPVLIQESPDALIVYGDVNSTVAAALAASKLQVPVVHVEAGLRSFDDAMPEEINRKVTDLLSDLLLITSLDAKDNLLTEGKSSSAIVFVGNPMIDSLLKVRDVANARALDLLDRLELEPGEYVLVTMHRPSNVDSTESFEDLVGLLERVGERSSVIFPAHPRIREKLEASRLWNNPNIRLLAPQPYATFVGLIDFASAVITDSGGIQEETTVLGIPCLTLRENTERPVTITAGTNRLVSRTELFESLEPILDQESESRVPPLWDGAAGPRIADAVVDFLRSRTDSTN